MFTEPRHRSAQKVGASWQHQSLAINYVVLLAEETLAMARGSRCGADQEVVGSARRPAHGEKLSRESAHCVALTLADADRQLDCEGARLGTGLLRSREQISQH